MSADLVNRSLVRLQQFMVSRSYRGYDPYDALTSGLFRLPLLRSWHLPRFVAQQVVRRSPVNLRPLLGVRPGLNPVTLGLALQGRTQLLRSEVGDASEHRHEIVSLLATLESIASSGYSGVCWGYDFDWEGRYVRIPALVPTIVATGIISNALFIHYQATGDPKALTLCKSAVHFVLNDLHRTDDGDGDGFCWSYSPRDRTAVFNATLKGARLLSQVYSATGEDQLREAARRTVVYVLKRQQPDGLWGYAHGDQRTWVDHFHTGYVLDCLHEYGQCAHDPAVEVPLLRAYDAYRRSLFTPDGIPKYYSTGLYPVDSTACAQAMLTLCRFGDVEAAVRVAEWAMNNLQREDGSFGYQVRRHYRIMTPFMRWSNAWMYAALCTLAAQLRKNGSS